MTYRSHNVRNTLTAIVCSMLFGSVLLASAVSPGVANPFHTAAMVQA